MLFLGFFIYLEIAHYIIKSLSFNAFIYLLFIFTEDTSESICEIEPCVHSSLFGTPTPLKLRVHVLSIDFQANTMLLLTWF